MEHTGHPNEALKPYFVTRQQWQRSDILRSNLIGILNSDTMRVALNTLLYETVAPDTATQEVIDLNKAIGNNCYRAGYLAAIESLKSLTVASPLKTEVKPTPQLEKEPE